MKRLSSKNICLGCDPEFFFSKSGKVLGAEKIIPERGIVYEPGTNMKRDGDYTSLGKTKSKIIIDGIQAELNPRPNTCRANLGNEISACFNKIYKEIKEKGIDIDFSGVIEVDTKEFDSLSEKSKKFGCDPDINVYKNKINKVKVNPQVYRKRSAGGHIHLGVNLYSVTVGGSGSKCSFEKDRLNLHTLKNGENIGENNLDLKGLINLDSTAKTLQAPDRLIPILDILLGNTCVLIDRDNLASERRRIYGKAGDYRLTPYGIEYRTLSNFWLKSYQLMSLVMGLARMSVIIIADNIDNNNNYEKEILEVSNFKLIEKAINKNDFELAMKNFLKVEPIILKAVGSNNFFPLNTTTIDKFKYFISKGIDFWFKEYPLEHWIKLPEGHGIGWENFCSRIEILK